MRRTCPASRFRTSAPAHPHIRGADSTLKWPRPVSSGSPPRARAGQPRHLVAVGRPRLSPTGVGGRQLHQPVVPCLRLTPTCVGRTHSKPMFPYHRPAHPHVRGMTSSARTRCPPTVAHPHVREDAFRSASLGSPERRLTATDDDSSGPARPLTTHPPQAWGGRVMSSTRNWNIGHPHGVGRTTLRQRDPAHLRLTSRCVGWNPRNRCRPRSALSPPRVWGERFRASCSAAHCSPAWDRLGPLEEVLAQPRLTPIFVGRTLSPAGRPAPSSAHPHVRGRTHSRVARTRVAPAHPRRAWGGRGRRRLPRPALWLTPTCVGGRFPGQGEPGLVRLTPRAWGGLLPAVGLGLRLRITPTCVGNALKAVNAHDFLWVTPELGELPHGLFSCQSATC